MTSPGPARLVLVAAKSLATAKSRLAVPDALRRRLALAMLADTARPWQQGGWQVHVVAPDATVRADLRALGVEVDVVPDRWGDLNVAVRQAAQSLGGRAVVACVGDLPCLTVAALGPIAEAGEPSFVADRSGLGTTMVCWPGPGFRSHFGPGSAAAHRADGLRDLAVHDVARHDVDTLDDLILAARLGLGPATRAAWDR